MADPRSEQQAANQEEWNDPSNWGGPVWLEVYFSKRDSRIWVPKRIRALGWTVNLAHTGGVLWFFGIILASIGLVIASAVWTIGFR
ncbi:MAG: DUF5808 domain-containing protein [Halioglobus sp.]|jgi:uncharacterized membrane protein|tara:strand:- start:12697 stop:12954 length:258 start_codon:yes stop_codon:yes gene_type:complete